jgi:hypothetical protein
MVAPYNRVAYVKEHKKMPEAGLKVEGNNSR